MGWSGLRHNFRSAGGGGLPSSSEIDLVVGCKETTGRAPFPVVCWADSAGGTTATGVNNIDRDLSFFWDFGDSTGRYASGATYQYTGREANLERIVPYAGHLYTEPGTYTITVYAYKSNGESEATTVTITVTGWAVADNYCVLPTAPTPNDESGWQAAGCAPGVFTANRHRVGTDLDPIMAGITRTDGLIVDLLAGNYTSTGGIGNADALSWRITGRNAATRPVIQHSTCTSELFNGRTGAGWFYADGFDYDGQGGAAEGCTITYDQELVKSKGGGVATQGIALYDIDRADHGILFNFSYNGIDFTANRNERISVVDVTGEDLEVKVTAAANLIKLDADFVLLLDNKSILTDAGKGEFHLRSQHRIVWYVAHNWFRGIAWNQFNSKSQVTYRACTGYSDCGGVGGQNSASLTSGLWSERVAHVHNIHEAMGHVSVLLGIAPENKDHCVQASRKHHIMFNIFNNTGADDEPGFYLVGVEGPTQNVRIDHNVVDAQNMPVSNDYFSANRGNGDCSGGANDFVPSDIQVIGNTIYGGTQTQAPNGIMAYLNGSNGSMGNTLVYAPNWNDPTVDWCEVGGRGACSAGVNPYAGLPSDGNVSVSGSPFAVPIPSGSTLTKVTDFKLKAGHGAAGIARPPAGLTDWTRNDPENNLFGTQAGVWANQP